MKKLSKIHQRLELSRRVAVSPAAPSHVIQRIVAREPMPRGSVDVETDTFPEEIPGDKEVLKSLLKGKKDKNCNRTACQRPGAFFLNIGTNKYYCVECAVDIGTFSLRTTQDPMDLFPSFDVDMARYEKDYTSTKPAYAQQQANWAKRQWADAREIYQRRRQKATA